MKDNSNSWIFLFDFYQSDPSIVSLLNKALSIKSNKTLRGDSFENFFEDLLSLLPTNVKRESYHDFLNYFKSSDKENLDVFIHENIFLYSFWLNFFIFDTSSKSIFSSNKSKRTVKKIVQKFGTNCLDDMKSMSADKYEHLPYLILYALDITKDWFLYGSNIKALFANEGIEAYFRLLRQQNIKKRRIRKKNHIKCLLSRNNSLWLSANQLYPIMILLIVLRREWEYSQREKYISDKLNSIKKTNATNIHISLIYGLYKEFDAKDQAIIDIMDSNRSVEFHPLVAKHIIETQSYKTLFKEYSLEIIPIKDYGLFTFIEQKWNKEKITGKRLLLDYCFPTTIIRENDVFLPKLNIADRIYISLMKGTDYQRYWRRPYDEELFDHIQIIDPYANSFGEYDDDRVIGYQNYLAPGGEFLVVKSEKDYELENKIKNALSDFRHDLKAIRTNLSNDISQLQKKWDSLDSKEQKKRIDRIKDHYDFLDAYIAMAGNPKKKKNRIQIVDFLRWYSRYIADARNSGTINYNVNDSAVPEDYTIYFNKALLTVILDSIVDNAIEHGFNDYHDCVTPTIEFTLVDTKQYLILKVCNNGRPIDITNPNDYKTRGVFAGPTGHTGLGGYLINKHMTQQGGKVELPLPEEKTWNTEIHLYLKKDGN